MPLRRWPKRSEPQGAVPSQTDLQRTHGWLNRFLCFRRKEKAGVVKLVDALDSKSCVREDVSVRVRPPVLLLNANCLQATLSQRFSRCEMVMAA
jgi:hypothetical protein